MRTTKAAYLFLQSRRAKGLSQKTIKWYGEILQKFAVSCKDIPKKPERIEQFFISLDVGDERLHGYYRTIKVLYRFLKRRKLIKNNPVEFIEEPRTSNKNPAVLTPWQLNKILNQPCNKKIKAALLTFTDTGARLAEVAYLTVDDLIETPDGFMVIVNGKTGIRLIPISYETYHALMVNLPFPWSKSHFGRLISQACNNVGINASALTFRHSFATLWEGDELILQQIMGHSTLETTKRYRHMRTQNAIKQHNQHTPLRMVHSFSKSML